MTSFAARSEAIDTLPWIAAGAGLVAGTALAIGGYHYAAMYPGSRLFGRALVAGTDPSEIALTYDDGPNEPYTGQLLDLFARHKVRATFFPIGRYARQKPHALRLVHEAGHLIGSHTMNHPALMYMGPKKIRAEIGEATSILEDIIGEKVRYFRPPFGARSPLVFHAAKELHLTPVLWNVSASDWTALPATEIEERLRQGIQRNRRKGQASNVLLHDGGHREMGTDRSRTVTATANLLAGAANSAYRFITLDAWSAGQKTA